MADTTRQKNEILRSVNNPCLTFSYTFRTLLFRVILRLARVIFRIAWVIPRMTRGLFLDQPFRRPKLFWVIFRLTRVILRIARVIFRITWVIPRMTWDILRSTFPPTQTFRVILRITRIIFRMNWVILRLTRGNLRLPLCRLVLYFPYRFTFYCDFTLRPRYFFICSNFLCTDLTDINHGSDDPLIDIEPFYP